MEVNSIMLKEFPRFIDLDEETFLKYFEAEYRCKFIDNFVVTPFSNALKESTGYSDENIPDEAKTITKEFKGLEFILSIKPTKKRQEYSSIHDKLKDYIELIRRDAKKRGIEGVYLKDNDIYILINDLIKKLDTWWMETPGVEIGIGWPDLDIPEIITIPLINYSELNDETAEISSKVKKFITVTKDSLINPCEKAMKEKSGYSNKNIPEKTKESLFPINNHLIRILSVPYPSPKYGAVINQIYDELKACLKAEPPGYKIEEKINEERHTFTYKIEKTGMHKENYVLLKNVRDRLKELLERNTETKLRQNLSLLPNAFRLGEKI